jgi:hypothetical protein
MKYDTYISCHILMLIRNYRTAPKKRSVAKIFGYTLGGLTAASGAGILAGSLYADMSVPVFTKHSVRFLRTAYVV